MLDQHKNEQLNKDDVKIRRSSSSFIIAQREELILSTRWRGQYTRTRISKPLSLAVFFAMPDIGGINAIVLYRLNKDKVMIIRVLRP